MHSGECILGNTYTYVPIPSHRVSLFLVMHSPNCITYCECTSRSCNIRGHKTLHYISVKRDKCRANGLTIMPVYIITGVVFSFLHATSAPKLACNLDVVFLSWFDIQISPKDFGLVYVSSFEMNRQQTYIGGWGFMLMEERYAHIQQFPLSAYGWIGLVWVKWVWILVGLYLTNWVESGFTLMLDPCKICNVL